MDDLDDLFDLSQPEGLLFGLASGMLDGDDETCACSCGCERRVPEPGDECRRCASGEHPDGGPDDGEG